MNIKQIKSEIEKIATETGCTFIEACQAMQSSALKMGNEKMITIIHKIKMSSIL